MSGQEGEARIGAVYPGLWQKAGTRPLGCSAEQFAATQLPLSSRRFDRITATCWCTPVNGHSQDRRACLKGANSDVVMSDAVQI